MSRFDLNDPLDFAKLTAATPSDLYKDITNGGVENWQLLEGSYKAVGSANPPVLFHIFKSKSAYQGALSTIQDSGGRRKVKYMFPYMDGQTTDDLGRRPEGFSLDILLFGSDYLRGLTLLLNEFNKPVPGDLVHPVRGTIRCVVEDVQLTHKNDQRKAVSISVKFIEHNFTLGAFGDLKNPKSLNAALSKALDAFQAITDALNAVQAKIDIATGTRNLISTLLNKYSNRFLGNLTDINTTFNKSGSSSLPGLMRTNNGGLVNSSNQLTSTTFPVAGSPSDPFLNVPTAQTQTTIESSALAVPRITKEVNATRADANTIITEMKATLNGQGSLEFHDEILGLKQSTILLQDALEQGVKSSNAQVKTFTTTKVMTLREIAYANGIDVSRVIEIDLLNTELPSTNFVDKGTSVKVPLV